MSSTMSKSPRRCTSVTSMPLSRNAFKVSSPVSGCDIGTARRHSAAVGVRIPSTHQPPSNARPSTAGI
ncbi:Uncharacterised protein [Mycobacterium tuberculosis]|nr:Uncharacterised protein [Mycobacterium tuberculosis]